MKSQNTSRAQRPEIASQPRAASRVSHDLKEANTTAPDGRTPDKEGEPDKDPEGTNETTASERQQDAAAEDFSARVEAEGEAALREAILDDLEIEDWEDEEPPRLRLEEDDGGAVSPEELGEQFLRGAAQQERHETRRLRVNVQPKDGKAPAPDRAAPRPPPSPRRKVASH